MGDTIQSKSMFFENQRFHKGVLDNIKDIVVITDLEGKIINVSKAVERYGWRRKNILGKKIHHLVKDELRKKKLDEIISTNRQGKISSGVIVLPTPIGRRKMEYRATPLKMEGEIVGSEVILKDVSEIGREEFEIFHKISTKILRILERESLYTTTYKELKDLVDFDYYLVGIYDKKRNVIRSGIGIRNDKLLAKRVIKADPKNSLLAWVVHNKKTLLIRDLENEVIPTNPINFGRPFRSWLGVPLMLDNEVLGVISIQSFKPYAFGEREKILLENVASHFTISLFNTMLYQELKDAKEKLETQVRKMNSLLDNIWTGVVIIKDLRILYTNEAFKKMLGYENINLVGAPILEFMHPDCRDRIYEYYKNTVSREDFSRGEVIVKFARADGRGIYARVIIKPIDFDGGRSFLITIEDITQLKNMENTILALTDSFRKIKIAESEDEIYDIAINSLKNVLNFNNAAIFKVVGEELKLVRTIGYRITHFNIDLYGEKGIVAWVSRNKRSLYVPDVTKEPLYIDTYADSKCEYATPIVIDGKVYGVLDVEGKKVDGISEEERNLIDMLAQHMSVALKGLEKQKALEKAKNYQELMLRIVSHDLKNPLSVISGYVELIKEEYVPEYMDVIEKAVERAFEIIDKARLFSKLGAKRIEEEKTGVDLLEEIKDVSTIILAKYPGKHISLEGAHMKISVYPLIREVFSNIMDNAFKYGADNLQIKVEKSKEYIIIRIADDGPGIPDDKKEVIFNAFEALEYGGSGLGLHIVKMIVDMHKGKVWVEDNKDGGSTFVIKLPMD